MWEMFRVKLRLALFLTLTSVGVGAGTLPSHTRGKQPAEEQSAPSAKAPDKQPRTDLYGDPLPPGALARLGTIRLRHLSADVAFSPDGKELISAGSDGTIRYWEPATGKEKRRVRVRAADSFAHPQVFATDGKVVAGLTSQDICVWETATGKTRKCFAVDKISIPGLENRLAQVWRLALSPDGKLLAAQLDDLKDRNLHLWNVKAEKKLFTLKLRQLRDSLAFSSDGKLLGTVSYNEGLQLWDTTTGKEVRKIAGAQNYLAFAPDGNRVAAVSRGGGVKVWNVADGKEVFDLKPMPEPYPPFLAFAPDNKTLIISFREELVFYDVVAGKKIRTIPVGAAHLVFSPVGKTAASISGNAIHLWDLATGKEIGPRAGHDSAVDSLAIAPDGSSVATFVTLDPVVRLWDAASGRPLIHVTADKYSARTGAFSPEGRFLVTGGSDNVLRLWDRKTGKEARKFTIESTGPARENLAIWAMALSPDGERLVSVVTAGDSIATYQVHVWDMATGKRLARRELKGLSFETRFSPDARSMTNQTAEEIVVADTVTGQELVKATGRAPLAFSPDGQVLALANFKPKPLPPGTAGPAGGDPGEVDAVCLVELATGKKLLRIETGAVGHNLLAYSPDGRTLATADRDGFRLWDVATSKELFRRALPEKYHGSFGYSFVTSLAFLADGDRLATGLMDSTLLIWDLEPKTWHAGIVVRDLAPRDLERLWADLADQDAAKAHQAVWTMAAVPAKAVPFLKEQLRPTAALDAKQVQRLIADLDSPEFAVRERAHKKLASFGEQAEPALRQALESKPSLEVRKRLETLHTDAELAGRGIVRSTELLRAVRAIRVLEHIGDREARQVLQKLAAGDPAARSTRQAKEALQRLERRSAQLGSR
jgi:WD40 repeat protein